MFARKTIIMLMGAFFLVSMSITGQIISNQAMAGGARLIYSHWSIEDGTDKTTLDQFAVPLTGFVPLAENLEARVYMATASSNLNQSNKELTLSGLCDARIQINKSLADDRLLLSLGSNLPVGKTKLDLAEEWPVMDFWSQNFLVFPIRRLGEGFGLNALLGGATVYNDYRLGATVMYHMYGTYEAYENSGDYNPGDMFSASFNLQRKMNNTTLSLAAIFSTYGTDELDNEKIFKQSNQLDLRLGTAHNAERFGIEVGLQYLIRGRNTRYDSTEAVVDQLKIFGNEFGLYGAFSIMPGTDLTLTPSAELKLMAGNEYDFDSSRLLGLGLAAGYRLSADLAADAGFKYYTGQADDDAFDLTGYQLSIGLSAAF